MKLKNKKEKPRNNIVILTVSLTLLFLLNNGIGGFNEFLETSMFYFLENRTIYVDYLEGDIENKEMEEFLQNQDDVQASFFYGMTDVVLDFDIEGIEKKYMKNCFGEVYLESYDYNVMENYMIGNEVKELGDEEILVARYANVDLASIADIEKNTEIIDMSQYIGKTIHGVVESGDKKKKKEYVFRIVGVYDNIKAGKPAMFYINDNVRKEMLDVVSGHIEVLNEAGEVEGTQDMIYYQIIMKDSKSVYDMQAKLKQKFPNVSILTPMEFPPVISYVVKGIIIVGDFILFFILFNCINNIIYVTEDNIQKRRKEFGILKAIGYRDKQIRNLLLKESVISSIKAIMISMIVGITVCIVVRYYINSNLNIYFQSIHFSTKPYTWILYLVIGFGIPLIGFGYANNRLKNITAIEALKEEE